MKLRIIKKGNKFYPQRKILCFWCYAFEGHNEHRVEKYSFMDAHKWIDDFVQSLNKNKNYSYEVVKEYDV